LPDITLSLECPIYIAESALSPADDIQLHPVLQEAPVLLIVGWSKLQISLFVAKITDKFIPGLDVLQS
jgi:hypothetical protein